MAISPQVQEKSAEVKRKYRLAFPVLGDPGHAYARQLSLAFTLPDLSLLGVYSDIDIAPPPPVQQ